MPTPPLFDRLESRLMFDGNVSIEIVAGSLFIRGDDQPNHLIIDTRRLAQGELRIFGNHFTTLNNSDSGPEVFTGITAAVRINLLGGDDEVMLDDADLPGALKIDTGNGHDTILVSNARINGSLVVHGQAQRDAIHLNDTRVQGPTRINSGDGHDILVADRSRFEGAFTARPGSGPDVVSFSTSTFADGQSVALDEHDRESQPIRAGFNFAGGRQGWEAGFADYPLGSEEFYELRASLRPVAKNLGGQTAFRIFGSNHSDDLFMYIKRALGPEHGVEPNTQYQIFYDLSFASAVPTGCSGIGGSPGDSVFLKAGASKAEPRTIAVPGDGSDGGSGPIPLGGIVGGGKRGELNVNKGNQSSSGPQGSVVGNISNGIPCDEAFENQEFPYRSIRRRHLHPSRVRSDEAGRLWLLVGTDSGYEGSTEMLYQRIRVKLIPLSDD